MLVPTSRPCLRPMKVLEFVEPGKMFKNGYIQRHVPASHHASPGIPPKLPLSRSKASPCVVARSVVTPNVLTTGQALLDLPPLGTDRVFVDNQGADDKTITVVLPTMQLGHKTPITITNVSATSRLVVQTSYTDRLVWNMQKHCSADVPVNFGSITVIPDFSSGTWSLDVQPPLTLL